MIVFCCNFIILSILYCYIDFACLTNSSQTMNNLKIWLSPVLIDTAKKKQLSPNSQTAIVPPSCVGTFHSWEIRFNFLFRFFEITNAQCQRWVAVVEQTNCLQIPKQPAATQLPWNIAQLKTQINLSTNLNSFNIYHTHSFSLAFSVLGISKILKPNDLPLQVEEQSVFIQF